MPYTSIHCPTPPPTRQSRVFFLLVFRFVGFAECRKTKNLQEQEQNNKSNVFRGDLIKVGKHMHDDANKNKKKNANDDGLPGAALRDAFMAAAALWLCRTCSNWMEEGGAAGQALPVSARYYHQA